MRDCRDCGLIEELEEKNTKLINEIEAMGNENTVLRDELDRKNTMRDVIEHNVIFEYEHGHTDIMLLYIAYLRQRNGEPPLENVVSKENDGYRWLEIADDNIMEFVKQLSNDELFIAIEAQLCEKYR